MMISDKQFKENTMLKTFPETPKKAFLDLENMKKMTPDELYIHTYLLNIAEDFQPTIRWIAETINCSIGKAHLIFRSLRTKGFIDLLKSDDGTSFIWVINAVPIEVTKHKEFLDTKNPELSEIRKARNQEIEDQIQYLTRKLEEGTVEDVVGTIKKINELELSKE